MVSSLRGRRRKGEGGREDVAAAFPKLGNISSN